MTLAWIIGFCLLGTVGGVGVAALFLLFPKETRQSILPTLLSFATGTLLATALLALIPHAMEEMGIMKTHTTVLIGIIIFLLLEKLILWRHCHEENCETHQARGSLILIGDTVHNFVDGIILAAAFMTSIPLGIATSIGIIAHEIPQETGDFAILIDSGFSRPKAFCYNIISGLGMVVGGTLAYFFLSQLTKMIPTMMALAAASFLYIAMSDLVPSLNKQVDLKSSIKQLIFLFLGIAVVVLLNNH